MDATFQVAMNQKQNKVSFLKKDLAVGITVYRPVFDDISNTLNTVKKSIDGYTLLMNIDPDKEKDYPRVPDRWGKKYTRDHDGQILTSILEENVDYLKSQGLHDYDEVLLFDEIDAIYKACFKDYLKNNEHTKMQLPYVKQYDYVPGCEEWFDRDFSIHKHQAKDPAIYPELWENEQNNKATTEGEGLILNWHFDEYIFKNERHYRHAVTGNMYINDDYESGRIMFLYGPNCDDFKNFDDLKVIAYKPMAGDLIFYPSFWPVAHSVTAPFKNDRYLISKIFKHLYNKDDFTLDFMEYCEKIYHDCSTYNFFNISSSNTKMINGKEIW